MAAEVVENRVYYEIRYRFESEYPDIRCKTFDSLYEAFEFYETEIIPNIKFMEKYGGTATEYLGCYRIHELNKVDLESYRMCYEEAK